MKECSFIIPFFQRSYCWKEKEIQKILDELLSKIQEQKQESIYFFRFVFSNIKKESEKMFIVDGQQRLISLDLLIKAIKKIKEDADISNFNISFENNEEIQEKYEKIKSPFKTNFYYIKNWIEENEKKNENFLKEIIEIIKKEIFIDYTKCNNLNDSFKIFEFLNSAGKKLSSKDIINSWFKKNKDKIKINNYDAEKLKCYCSVYYLIILNKKDSNKNKKNLNFNIDDINDFFKIMKTEKEEFDNFCKEIKNFETKEEENKFIFDIIKDINRDEIAKIIYLMFYKKINIKEEKNKSLLFGLCLLSITMSLKTTNPSVIRKLYYDICDEILKKTTGHVNIKTIIDIFMNFTTNKKEYLIEYNEFNECLNKAPTKIKKAIFEIDVYKNNNSGYFGKLDIEHIYAKKDDSTYRISSDTNKNEKMTESIGNLLLMDSTKNKSLSNKEVKDKLPKYKKIFEEEKGLHSKEGINFIDVDKFNNNKEIDLENFITKRIEEIMKYIYNNFPYANEIIKK